MGFAWNWLALPGLVAAASALALLPLVLRGRRSRASVLVAAILAAQLVSALCGFGLAYLTDDRRLVYNLVLVTQATLAIGPYAAILLLGELPLPALRWLRSRATHVLAGALAAAVAAGAFLAPQAYTRQLVRASYAPWVAVPGPVPTALAMVSLAVLALALALSFLALRHAPPGTPARERVEGFLLAFGFRNVLALLLIVTFFLLPPSDALDVVGIVVGGLGQAVFVALLAHAILRTQLFDIDLRLKRGVRRTTLAASFIAAFFVVSELASALLSDRIGTVAGVLAAGALVFALAPLQRAAERVADTAMPRVRGTPTYLAYRKMQVYRAALEGAMDDGALTQRERAMLARLRAELAIPEADADALETDLRAPRAPA